MLQNDILVELVQSSDHYEIVILQYCSNNTVLSMEYCTKYGILPPLSYIFNLH